MFPSPMRFAQVFTVAAVLTSSWPANAQQPSKGSASEDVLQRVLEKYCLLFASGDVRVGTADFELSSNALFDTVAKDEAPRLQKLLEERLAIAEKAEQQIRARVRAFTGLPSELLEATRQVRNAALELCKTDKKRVAVLEKSLAASRENEELCAKWAQAQQGRESDMLAARAERLRVEIALERTKKGAPPAADDGKKGPVLTGYIQAYESVKVYSRAAGFVKTLKADIGDRVQNGQVLAVLDAPDLEAQVRHDEAALQQAKARLLQAKAVLQGADAEVQLGRAMISHAEAAVKNARAEKRYREMTLQRMQKLFDAKAIEKGVVDEAESHLQATVNAEALAVAAVDVAKGKLQVNMSRVEQAKASLLAAEADVEAANAILDKSRVKLSFATIRAPFDGVVTRRGCAAGDFVASADDGRNREPLFVVERTDLMRVIVDVPERDVALLRPGQAAEIRVDAFPGKKWAGKVARMGQTVTRDSGTMRVEIDLSTDNARLISGMTCRVDLGLIK